MNQPVTKPEDEPSMEEILASIRKIISDDDVKGAEDQVKAADTTSQPIEAPQVSTVSQPVEAFNAEDEDVLELTDMVDEAGNPIREEIPEEPVAIIETPQSSNLQENLEEPEVMLESEAVSEVQKDAIETFEAPVEDMNYSIASDEDDEEIIEEVPSEPLISEPSLHEAAAALGALSRVASQAARPKEPQMEGMPSQKTTEELVKEILKPLLKEWLDANLPSLVKWIVAEQVEKIVQEASGYTTEVQEN